MSIRGTDGFYVYRDRLVIEMTAPHQQVLPFFPQYRPDVIMPGAIVDYRDPNNITGHQQRGLLTYYAIKAFIESGGGVGLDCGGAGVPHPACLSLDLCAGEQKHPTYGGQYTGVHVKGDAADLSMFQDDSFSCILSNHLCEHLPCIKLRGGETAEEKIKLACPGKEIADILRYHWVRILRPGGWFVHIIPDNRPATESGSHVFYQDSSHYHSWQADEFYNNILSGLTDILEIVEFNTFNNNFSFNVVGRKK